MTFLVRSATGVTHNTLSICNLTDILSAHFYWLVGVHFVNTCNTTSCETSTQRRDEITQGVGLHLDTIAKPIIYLLLATINNAYDHYIISPGWKWSVSLVYACVLWWSIKEERWVRAKGQIKITWAWIVYLSLVIYWHQTWVLVQTIYCA